MTRIKLMKYGCCILHAFWLLMFTWFWLNQSYTYKGEALFIQWSSVLKKLILGFDSKKPPPNNYIFINVNKDRVTIENENRSRTIIVDRERLATLFEILNRQNNQHQFIICDILFEENSNHDKKLISAMSQTERFLIASTLSLEKDSLVTSKIITMVSERGLVEYTTTPNNAFYKFKLSEEQFKSLPLQMYEMLYKKQLTQHLGFHFVDKNLSLNAIVVDFKVRNHDLASFQYPQINLFELLSLLEANEKEFYNAFLKDKIIVIGDFESDVQETAFGDIAGSLILLNVYLGLLNQENLVSWKLILFLFLVYLLISYSTFFSLPLQKSSILWRIYHAKFFKIFGYLIILHFVSLVSYFAFGLHINILIIALYLGLIKLGVTLIQKQETSHRMKNQLIQFFILSKSNHETNYTI